MATNNSLNNSSSPFDVDNLNFTTNTISSTDTNGSIIFDPDGTGEVQLTSGDLNLLEGVLSIDPGGASDGYIQWNESTASRWRGGNDATDDSFRISQGSALGTNDTFVMTSSGVRTMPLQTAFFAQLSSNDSNVTGNGAVYTLGSGNVLTEVFDQNNDFNASTGVFTAPVTGTYHFEIRFRIGNIGATGANDGIARIVTSNFPTGYVIGSSNPTNTRHTGNGWNILGNILVDMDVSDTATFTVTVNGSASDNLRVTSTDTWVQGYLIG